MKIKLENGVEYWVSWIHNNTTNQKDTKMDKRKRSDIGSYTECYIENKTNPMEAAIGTAILAKGDRFCKDKGRKLAMKRAMIAFGLNKPTRKLFWIEYFKMTNKLNSIKQ